MVLKERMFAYNIYISLCFGVIKMRSILLRALESGEKLEMIYIAKNNEMTHRTIKVLSVGFDSFTAFCYLRNKQRTFLMKNILSVGPKRMKYNKNIS